MTKKGEAKAVILGIEDFLQAIVKTPQSLAALQAQTRTRGGDKLTLEDVAAEIAAVRRVNPRSKA